MLAKLLSARPAEQKRLFHVMSRLRKDEKSKQLLKGLGMSLQKGNLSHQEESEEDYSKTKGDDLLSEEGSQKLSSQALTEKKNHLNKLMDAYDSISHMSVDDLAIQKNLDEGKQFSFPSEHYLDRKKIIRNLPDEIDIFNTPMKIIKKTYADLSKLDQDKSVHLKYYKRYLKKYDDPINHLIQEFNGITAKFKLLRRREIDNLSLAPGAFLYNENLLNNPYNVIGFDRSISGLPLRNGKNKLTDATYPKEFIEDLQMFRKKLPVHKRDLDFIEYEENSVNVNPSRIKNNRTSKEKEMDKVLDSLYEQLDFPKSTILVDAVDNYKTLNLNPDALIRVENEILYFKKSLQQEIESYMKANGNKLLMFRFQDLKTNQFRLCEAKLPSNINSSLVIVNYSLKEFNMIPYFASLMSTRHHKTLLKRHLFKTFMFNLEDQVDTLFRIKYYEERLMNKFMKKLTRNIEQTIRFKLIRLFQPIIKDSEFRLYDAFLFKPNTKNAFKRIYWLNNSTRRSNNLNRKSNLIVNWTDLSYLSER